MLGLRDDFLVSQPEGGPWVIVEELEDGRGTGPVKALGRRTGALHGVQRPDLSMKGTRAPADFHPGTGRRRAADPYPIPGASGSGTSPSGDDTRMNIERPFPPARPSLTTTDSPSPLIGSEPVVMLLLPRTQCTPPSAVVATALPQVTAIRFDTGMWTPPKNAGQPRSSPVILTL